MHYFSNLFDKVLYMFREYGCRVVCTAPSAIVIPLHLSWTASQTIPGMESLNNHSVFCSFPRRTFFTLLPLASSYGLLLPRFRHQKEAFVASTKETKLIGHISDAVRPKRGTDFVA